MSNVTKKCIPLLLALCLLAGCGRQGEKVEVVVFAAASLTEALDEIIESYRTAAPGVSILPTYDSSGTLLTQIQQGAVCDLFFSAAPKQMDVLEEKQLLLEGSRVDLLENKVVLAVPAGNPAGIKSFDQLGNLLYSGEIFLSVGNSDVPVGQYTQRLFSHYSIDEASVSKHLTYGTNAKEVTTQIAEATVDCGIIYATDARAAGLDFVDSATAEQCGQVIYPAAVLAKAPQQEAAAAFLAYLSSPNAAAIFSSAGFTPLS